MTQVGEGTPEPLGVRLEGDGANVAVFSGNATSIEFCIFDADSAETRIALPARTGDVFHGHIPGVREGTRYGLRAHGPWAPQDGHRFDPTKLLLDPLAEAVDRPFVLHPAMFPATAGDSATVMPKGVVLAPGGPEWARPQPTPWSRSFIYELHVRGFSMRHPDIPPPLRGTFAALGHPAAIAHFRRLGVTTLEVMPASVWIDERHLPPLGLTNYWGYNPVNYLAPDPRLAPGGWAEIRAATDALAAAGIDVMLDVVFNHSGEGDVLGPTLSLRGLDNAGYYRLPDGDRAGYINDTGCGNTLALDRPQVVRLAMDAMRVWVRRGGMAGFRFDLATTLGRRRDGFDPETPLFSAMRQDPELRELRMVAEPWDIGPGGYQLGRFPPLWGEWNDRFRDGMRRFWGDHDGTPAEFATRFAGSSDVFAPTRRPSRSINFITAHDGFTLADLVAYTAKRNLSNGEANRDGGDGNLSWNNGVEGESDSAMVTAARARDQRALLASLLLSRGTPMLAMGSELGQSQQGNNNAYAQDNAISWLDWAGGHGDFAAFIGAAWRLRQSHAVLQDDHWLLADGGDGVHASWHAPDGTALMPDQWQSHAASTLMIRLRHFADSSSVKTNLSGPSAADGGALVVVVHRSRAAATINLPEVLPEWHWQLLLDSTRDQPDDNCMQSPLLQTDTTLRAINIPARCVLVFALTPTATLLSPSIA